MKKILILITILIMAIASCSSPTAIKNNGGGSDINDNTSTNPPVVVPPDNGDNDGSGGNDSGNTGGDNNTGGGSNGGDTGTGGGNGNGSTGGDNGNNGGNNGGGTTPEPEPQYQGLAKRIAKYNESVIGKTYTSSTGFTDYKLTINKDGTITIYMGSTYNNIFEPWNWDAGWSTNPIVIMEKDAYSDRFNPTIDSRTDHVTKVRVRLVDWDKNGNPNLDISQNARRMFEIEFKDNYRQAVIKRTPPGPSYEHIGDFNYFVQETGVAEVTVTVQD